MMPQISLEQLIGLGKDPQFILESRRNPQIMIAYREALQQAQAGPYEQRQSSPLNNLLDIYSKASKASKAKELLSSAAPKVPNVISAANIGPTGSLASTPASNAAWNAAATEAGGGLGAVPGQGLLGGIGPAGLLAGAYTGYQQGTGVKDFFEGKGLKTPQKIALALPTFGASLFSDQLQSAFGLKPKTQVEDKRLRKLAKKGVRMHTKDFNLTDKSRDEQLQDALKAGAQENFAGKGPGGKWLNTAWLASGNEKDLKPEDIWGYSAFYDKFGDDWLGKFSEGKRRDVAQKALDLGIVDEHHGTIDLKESQDFENYLQGKKPKPTGKDIDPGFHIGAK